MSVLQSYCWFAVMLSKVQKITGSGCQRSIRQGWKALFSDILCSRLQKETCWSGNSCFRFSLKILFAYELCFEFLNIVLYIWAKLGVLYWTSISTSLRLGIKQRGRGCPICFKWTSKLRCLTYMTATQVFTTSIIKRQRSYHFYLIT